jgi:hypothetical protein
MFGRLLVKPVTQRISNQAIEADKRVFPHLRTKLAEVIAADRKTSNQGTGPYAEESIEQA